MKKQIEVYEGLLEYIRFPSYDNKVLVIDLYDIEDILIHFLDKKVRLTIEVLDE